MIILTYEAEPGERIEDAASRAIALQALSGPYMKAGLLTNGTFVEVTGSDTRSSLLIKWSVVRSQGRSKDATER